MPLSTPRLSSVCSVCWQTTPNRTKSLHGWHPSVSYRWCTLSAGTGPGRIFAHGGRYMIARGEDGRKLRLPSSQSATPGNMVNTPMCPWPRRSQTETVRSAIPLWRRRHRCQLTTWLNSATATDCRLQRAYPHRVRQKSDTRFNYILGG